MTKAKLEAVAADVSIFEDEFLANVVMPDGQLAGEQVRPSITAAYDGRDIPDVLSDYSGGVFATDVPWLKPDQASGLTCLLCDSTHLLAGVG